MTGLIVLAVILAALVVLSLTTDVLDAFAPVVNSGSAVLAVAFVFCTFWDVHWDINHVILYGGRWFVRLIMVYYVFIYVIGVYFRDKLNWVLAFASLVLLVWYYCMNFPFPFSLYAGDGASNKWFVFFIFMLWIIKIFNVSSG